MIVAGVFVLISTGLVQAEIVTGVTVHDYSTEHGSYPAANSVNGTTTSTDGGGLSYQSPDVWHHENVPANMYLAFGGNTSAWLEFDLGAVTTLTEIHLWNYNQELATKTIRGVQTFDVWVSDTGGTGGDSTINGAWTKIASDLTLAEAPGASTYAGERFDTEIPDTAGRYVRIDMKSTHGGGPLGLSEVHFYANPAVNLNLTNAVNNQWTTGDNWYTNGTANLHGSLPTRIDSVWVTGAMELSGGASVTGTANNVTMNPGADLTITDNATLNASAVSLESGGNTLGSGGELAVAATGILNATSINDGKSARLRNSGVITLTQDLDWITNKGVAYNYANGTINARNLNIGGGSNKKTTFENSGAFNGATLESTKGNGTVNLTGGTMTFGYQTFFTDGGTMNLSNDGTLIIEGRDMVRELQTAIGAGGLNGVTADLVAYVGGDTIVPYYVTGTVISIQ